MGTLDPAGCSVGSRFRQPSPAGKHGFNEACRLGALSSSGRASVLQAEGGAFKSRRVHNAAETPVSVAGVPGTSPWLTHLVFHVPSAETLSPLRWAVGSTSLAKWHVDTERSQALVAGGRQPQRTQALESGTKETGQAHEAMTRDPEICVECPHGGTAYASALGAGFWGFDSLCGYMAKAVEGEWQLSDDEALRAAIHRLPAPEHEVRQIEARWRKLRKLAQDPGGMIGWKY